MQHVFGFIGDSIDVEIEEIMEMRLRRHAKGDGPWEEEQDFQLPDASGGSSFRREAQSVKSTSQVRNTLKKLKIDRLPSKDPWFGWFSDNPCPR